MARQKIVEILLDRVQLREIGGAERQESQHLLLVTLVWPRARIEEAAAVKPITLTKKTADVRKASWTERIIFKQLVEGPFGIHVAVTKRVSGKQAPEFLKFLAAQIFGIAGKEIEDLAVQPVAGALARIPFRYLSKSIPAGKKAAPKIIAEGSLDLNTEKLKKRKRSPIHVPIEVAETIYRPPQRDSTKGRKPSSRRRVLVKKGEENGSVDLTAVIA